MSGAFPSHLQPGARSHNSESVPDDHLLSRSVTQRQNRSECVKTSIHCVKLFGSFLNRFGLQQHSGKSPRGGN